MLPNKARGETTLLIDGVARRLCVTLGALARLEAALEAENLEALANKMSRLTAREMLLVVRALLLAEDWLDDLEGRSIDAQDAARAIAEAFELAFRE